MAYIIDGPRVQGGIIHVSLSIYCMITSVKGLEMS